jgi:ABC-type multidrug transport system fused ATPase/permease subunit
MSISLATYFNLLVAYLRPQWKRASILALFLLASIALQLLNPQILRFFIDTVVKGGEGGSLVGAAILFLAIGVVNQFFTIGATGLGAEVGWTATNMLRSELAKHSLKQDMSFHNNRTPGELIERIDGDVTALANFFSQFMVRILGAALLMVGVLILLTVEDWRVGIAELIYAVIALTILNHLKNIAVAASEREREASAVLYGFIEERLSGIDDIRANGGGNHTMHRFHHVLGEMFHKGRRAWMKRSSMWVTIISLFTVGDVIAIGMGIWLFQQSLITLGTVFLFFQYTQMMWNVVEQIVHQMQDLQKAGASIGRVEELMREHSTMKDGRGTPIPSGPLEVEFDHVTFAYGTKGTVLYDLSFRLEPGTTLGLLGRTGSGKSTMTRLLFRLYDTTAGSIRLGGTDIRDAHIAQLRGRVAMVTQEVQLFHATVRDNLTFFNREIPDERIHRVIEELGLSEWYASMPDGLDTHLGTGGGGLSAGEAQLVAFTRVFLQDPGLIILDEPSSRMDLATERLLEDATARLLRNRTAIIIAHRLRTVQRADKIMILDKGVIAEYADRELLVDDVTSRFSELLRTGLEHTPLAPSRRGGMA